MARIGLKLREAVKAHGVPKAVEVFREGLAAKKFSRSDLSLREMAESMLGERWAVKLKEHVQKLRENAAAVDASGFSAITGQLLVDVVKEKYKLATFVGDRLFSVNKVTNGNLGTYREPYLSDATDDPAVVQQMQSYPATDFVAQYIDHPAPQKFGRICRVSFEMIYSDLTGQAIDSAASVGRRVGLWVEKQKLRVVIGVVNPYTFNGTNYNTYQTAAPWVNKLTDFTLTSWRAINRIEQLFNQMLDPVIGEPIEIEAPQVLTVPALKYTAKRILGATETRSGNEASDTGDLVVAPNPLDDYELLVSKHLRKRLTDANSGNDPGLGISATQADTVVIAGDFKKAFVWREVNPMQTVQAPPQSPAEFEQDVVLQVKANVFGVASVRDPRYVTFNYNSAA